MRIRRFSSLSPARIRVLATLMLGFQAFLWGGGSIVEARAAAESLTRYSHIEDQGATKCPPIHSHLDCVICRTMSGAGDGGSAPALAPIAAREATRPVSDVVTSASVGFSGPLGSRAPPGDRPIRGPVA